jgi:hypothetical protein
MTGTGWLYCGGLLLLGGALYLVLAGQYPWLSGTEVREELVKVGIQVFVFGLAGGGVKLLLDRQAEERKFRSDILERLGRAHQDVYRVRRLLPSASPEEKRALLRELMDARQELGATSHVLRLGKLGAEVEKVRAEMDAMRDYLEVVIQGALAPEGTPDYSAFLEWQVEDGPYQARFKDPYFRVKELVDPSFRRPTKKAKTEKPAVAVS